MFVFSPFGYALRALRDSSCAPRRSASRGAHPMGRLRRRRRLCRLAGALYAFLKGSVFPDNLGIPLSIDGLVMVLLGGVGTASGGVVGAGL